MKKTLLLASMACALVLTGCSDDADTKPAAKASKSAGASASAAVDPAKVSPADLVKVPELKGAKGAVSDASFGDCSTEAGARTVTGTVTSTASKARDYAVTVSWTNDSSDVLSRGVEVLKNVAPKGTRDFTIKAQVPAGVTTCTFRVERGSVQ